MKVEILANGNLKISVDEEERANIQIDRVELEDDFFDSFDYLSDLFEKLIANSEYDWVSPAIVGTLTDAPILATFLSDDSISACWAFMPYEVTTPQRELAEYGYCIWERGGDD